MKSIFRNCILIFVILIGSKIEAREIILIENMAQTSTGELLKSILIKKFHFPEELITLKNINQNCEERSEAIMHLCLDQKGELNVKKLNQFVVRNSFRSFLNQEIN